MFIPFLFAASLLAGEITLQWNSNSEADLNGYYVYYGKTSRQYGVPIKIGNSTNYTVPNLDAGSSYYFAVTALDTSGNESGFSTEIKAAATESSNTGGTGQTTVSLWWTAYSTRSTAVPVKIYDGSSLLATVKVNQKLDGGKWNTLGAYNFSGTPKIVVVADGTGTACADAVKVTTPDGTIAIVDNGQANTSQTGTWKTSSGTGAYGASSVYASSSATYTFGGTAASTPPPPVTADKTTVSLWWTAYSTRSTAVPVKIYDGSSLLATVKVNQKLNGSQWNTLGSYAFSGKPRIVVVADGTGTACADAVKVTTPDGTTAIVDNGQAYTSQTGTWMASSGSGSYGTPSIYATNSATYSFGAN
jgi:hypothetical protein